MANKKNKASTPPPAPKPAPAAEIIAPAKSGFNIIDWAKNNDLAPGIVLSVLFFLIGLIVYKDYGICWDEPLQRGPGVLSWEYIFDNNEDLFNKSTDNHGAGFELLLVMFEKWFSITDSKAIYEMRHIVTHIVFILGSLAGYVLALRLFKNRLVATLGFLMLMLAPRMYAHSFYNSKDIPFMSVFMITLMLFRAAFALNKKWLFALLGLACGYATSIRIMGIMLACFIVLFLIVDIIGAYARKEEKANVHIINFALFCVGFCFTVYMAWPYLWKDPVTNFVDSFAKMSHFNLWTGIMLLGGKYVSSMALPWTYFPTWFLISNPIVWLIFGFAGFIWAGIAFLGRPLHYLRNTPERNTLLHLMSFVSPIAAVLILHSIIYDDWRHLYFVYPSFVMLALWFANKMMNMGNIRFVMLGAAGLQVCLLGAFMVSAHPFQQVYFNETVAHTPESLRRNYELEYWGCSYKQGLDYLVKTVPAGPIRINSALPQLIFNNVLILNEQDRNRIQFVEDPAKAEFIITNYRNHSYDYPFANSVYSIKVQNSTILNVFRQETDSVKSKEALMTVITRLNTSLAAAPSDVYTHAELGDAWFMYGNYDSAFAHHFYVLQTQPGTLAIIDRAGEYFVKGKYPEAVQFCKRAMEINPRDINAYVNIGLCYMRLNKLDSAINYLRQGTVVDPQSSGAYQNLAYTFLALRQVDSAKKYEAEARKLTPEFRLPNTQ